MSENLEITKCKVFNTIQKQFLLERNWKNSWGVLCLLKNKLGKKINVLSEKKLFIFKIDGNIDLKIKIKTKGNARAAIEALCCYIILHSTKRVLCAECELNGTEECLAHFLRSAG